jgi:hypothetical protein
MGGGSVGFQAGVQAADIVLVFATPRSLQGLLNGQKVTLGADASIAVGPVGRQANAGTDAQLGAEIYSYARSRGLFLGVSLGGSDLSVDNNANSMLYGRFGVTPADVFQNRGIGIRPEVRQLVDNLNAKSRPVVQQAVAVPVQPGQPVQPVQQVVGPPPFIQQAAPQPAPQPVAQPVAQPVQPAPVAAPQPQTPPLVPIK